MQEINEMDENETDQRGKTLSAKKKAYSPLKKRNHAGVTHENTPQHPSAKKQSL